MGAESTEVTYGTGVKRHALWSLVTQGLVSASGLISAVVGARELTPDEFGQFAALLTVAAIFVGLAAAFLAQPLLLVRGDQERLRAQARSTLVGAVVLGTLVAALLAVASLMFGGMRHDLLVLAVSFPLLATCEAFRYIATVLGHAAQAAMADGARLALFLGMYLAHVARIRAESSDFALLWCGSAVIVGLVVLVTGLRMTRGNPVDLGQFTRVSFLGFQFSLEALIGMFGSAVPSLSLGWFVAVGAIGHFRGVSTLFGPILVLATSAVMVMSPLLVRREPARRTVLLVAMAALFNITTLLWMAFLLLLPDTWGVEILGEVWEGSRKLIVPAALQTVGLGILTTAQVGIRVARPRMSFVMNVGSVVASASCFLLGVLTNGLIGAMWGLMAGSFIAAAFGISIYVRVKDTPGQERGQEGVSAVEVPTL